MTALLLDIHPTVGTFHAAGESASYRAFTRPLRWLREHLDIAVAVSKDARALVAGHLGGDYEVLFNGVEIDRFAAAAPWAGATSTRRRRWVFFCGRHEERKGLDVLLAAFAGLPADVGCWVASDGPDTARLRAEYAGDTRIQWLGRISDEEKVARLRAADVFCAPSLRGESFGVVLLEAMAAGTPVVASALEGYRNVATEEVDAVLTPPGDVDGLTAGLLRVLDDAALAARLRTAGRMRADDFSMSSLATIYLDLYHAAIEHRALVEQQRGGDRRRLGWRVGSRRVGRRQGARP
jgi:phosphatidyl-myo-inositol alpha-mannosyltransferase